MYEQTYRRLEKLKTTFDQLVVNNQKQYEKIHELSKALETSHEREVARERVLKSLNIELANLKAKYIPELARPFIFEEEERIFGESLPPPT